jgi:hypothetical protein
LTPISEIKFFKKKLTTTMRTRIIFSTLVAFALFFTACEQENLLGTVEDLSTLSEQPLTLPNAQEAIDLTKEFSEPEIDETDELESRSTLIYSTIQQIGVSTWFGYFISKVSLWDPLTTKYEVVLTPITGNPDLYLQGYDPSLVGDARWRVIRGVAAPSGVEKLTFRRSDLKSFGKNETSIYIGVWGKTATRFKVEIFRQGVNCKEHPAADQITTLEYAPVCGCDGVQYSNKGAAFVSGITSWTNGPCPASCTCGSGLGTVQICDNFETYDTGLPLTTQAVHWKKWSVSSLEPQLLVALGGGPGISVKFTDMLINRKAGSAQPDILLTVGNKNSGIHRFKWKMLVPNANSGYFNIQRFTTPGQEFGEQFYFNTDGTLSLQYGNTVFANVSYPKSTWFELELIINLNTRRYVLAIDGVMKVKWHNPNGSSNLGAIDFFPAQDNAWFRIDDVCFEQNLSASPYSQVKNEVAEMAEIELKTANLSMNTDKDVR